MLYAKVESYMLFTYKVFRQYLNFEGLTATDSLLLPFRHRTNICRTIENTLNFTAYGIPNRQDFKLMQKGGKKFSTLH
jgi:hypothetical protein